MRNFTRTVLATLLIAVLFCGCAAELQNTVSGGTASLLIRADEDVLLSVEDIEIVFGESVLELLERCCLLNEISVDSSSGYVKMIGGISEFDEGLMSGWMFKINGENATKGAGDIQVKDGDSIEWFYSKDLLEEF